MAQSHGFSSLDVVQHVVEDIDLSILVAILGARMHYAVPVVLAQKGLLNSFHTDIFLKSNGMGKILIDHLNKSPIRSFRHLAGRSDDRLNLQQVHTYPLLGILYTSYLRLVHSSELKEWGYNRFGSWFARSVAKSKMNEVDAIYSCKGAALEVFEYARIRDISCILEQIITPYPLMKRLLDEECNLWPDWGCLESQDQYSPLEIREEKERDLADGIISGSQFVVDGLVNCGVPQEKCYIVPYAVDIEKYRRNENKPHENPNSINILFLGTVSLRKGIQYLQKALDYLDSTAYSVKIVGKIEICPEAVKQLGKRCELLGLTPRSEVQKLLDWADILVLPSICEGSAIVTYEALASGVPVITTPNAGSVVRDGLDGFIVPIRDVDALADRLETMALNPRLRADMSREARDSALKYLSWESYAKRLVHACSEIMRRKSTL